MKLTGTVNLQFNVDTEQCVNALFEGLGFSENCFIKDNKLFENIETYYGSHSSFEDILKSSDIKQVELFNAIKLLKDYFNTK